MKRILPGILLLTCSTIINAQISGVIFRDINGNGVRNSAAGFVEPYVAGITVKATITGGTNFTTTTNSSGLYSFSTGQIPSGTKVRIEFTGLAKGDYTSFIGSGNGSNVQFTTAPNSSVNYALNAPDDYWDNNTLSQPPLMLVNSRRGTTNGFYNNQYTILEINNNVAGPYLPLNENVVTVDTSKRHALHYQTGSLFGLAVQSKQERFFSSSLLKRGSGFGPKGPGGIYIIGKSGSSWTLSGSFTLQGVTPSNGGGVIDFGSVTRVTSPATDNNYISDNHVWSSASGSDTRDMDAFAKAGTISYGDIEADQQSDDVYMVNMFQKSIIVFNGIATNATLNNASAATLSAYTRSYSISSLPGCPAVVGAGNNLRPFAVKIYKEKGYLGVVSDGMATQNIADVMGYILQFDPQNIAAGFTTVVTINFSNYKDIWGATYWNPWVTNWLQTGGNSTTGPIVHAQPMISGIEFNEDGSMDIGIRDRWGDQGATFEYIPMSGATDHVQTAISGDILHACKTATGWAVEGTAGACDQPVANLNTNSLTNSFGFGFNYGNTGKEWYADRSGDGDPESNEGGLTKLMGTGIIVSTVYDPMGFGETVGSNYWSTHGVQWNSNTSGVKDHIARIQGNNSNSMDKANGLGDLEFLTQSQPIEIGNRIWFDINENGIQDPEEGAGLVAGTIVTLRSPGADGYYGNGDDQTWTTTTDANGNYYFTSLSTPDNRKPASWTGVGNAILKGYYYRVEIALPLGKYITITNVGANTQENIDNDAIISDGKAVISFNTNEVNHNFDFGISNIPLPLKLVSFTAQLKPVNKADLAWTTVFEENVNRFVIQKSQDGTNFTNIGTVKATGFSSNVVNYNFTDDLELNPSLNIIYYRLQSIDNDGKFEYSEIRILKLSNTSQLNITVFPNPVNNDLRVTIPAYWQNKKVKYEVALTNGQVVKTIEKMRSNQTEVFDLSHLSSGVYIIKATSNGVSVIQKVLKL